MVIDKLKNGILGEIHADVQAKQFLEKMNFFQK
jgi:hypothetical protein